MLIKAGKHMTGLDSSWKTVFQYSKRRAISRNLVEHFEITSSGGRKVIVNHKHAARIVRNMSNFVVSTVPADGWAPTEIRMAWHRIADKPVGVLSHALKWICRHVGEIFVAGCTGSCAASVRVSQLAGHHKFAAVNKYLCFKQAMGNILTGNCLRHYWFPKLFFKELNKVVIPLPKNLWCEFSEPIFSAPLFFLWILKKNSLNITFIFYRCHHSPAELTLDKDLTLYFNKFYIFANGGINEWRSRNTHPQHRQIKNGYMLQCMCVIFVSIILWQPAVSPMTTKLASWRLGFRDMMGYDVKQIYIFIAITQ